MNAEVKAGAEKREGERDPALGNLEFYTSGESFKASYLLFTSVNWNCDETG